jgi:hypothetical protein
MPDHDSSDDDASKLELISQSLLNTALCFIDFLSDYTVLRLEVLKLHLGKQYLFCLRL